MRGWPVFPLKVGAKVPATRSGVYAATDDLVTVRRWWAKIDYNIGIYTGEAKLLVVDCDVKPEGVGLTYFLTLCADNDFDVESTYCVVTPSSGLHIYFAVENGFWYPPGANVIAPLIDIRSSGSYVAAAGSEIDGVPYERVGADVVLPLPDWLAPLVDKPPPDTAMFQRHHDADLRASDAGRGKAFQGIAEHFRDKSTAGIDRNMYFYWAVRAVGDHLWPGDFKEAGVQELQAIAHEIGLTDTEIKDTTASARRRWP